MNDAALHRTCLAHVPRPITTSSMGAPRFVLRMPVARQPGTARPPARVPAIDPRRASFQARWHSTLDGRTHPTLHAWALRLAELQRQLEEARCLRGLARRRRQKRGLAAAYGFLGAQRLAKQDGQ
jgi:hypothetical protein